AARAAGASAFLQRVVHAGADGRKRRQQTAEDASDDGKYESESDNRPVKPDVRNERQCLRQQTRTDVQGNGRENQSNPADGPGTPPVTTSARLCSSAWRSSLRPLDPRARRTANSRRRRIARTSSSPARFAHAISSTTATARKSVRTRGRACRMVSACRPFTMA